MNTTITPVTAEAPTLVAPPHPARRDGAVLALARFETRELLLQIPVLVFFALYVGLVVLRAVSQEGMDAYPILHMVDRRTQTAPLLFAIALLVCANAAALRSRRHGTVQQFGVLAMDPWLRTLAHLLSVVPFAALTAVVVVAEFTREALKPGAIGHGSFGELAIGPVTVLLAGVVGVLLARLLPSPFVPILFVVSAYVLTILLSTAVPDWELVSRFLPVFYSDLAGSSDPVPADLLGRPAAWHALYVAGLCAVLTCVTLLFSGGRTRAVRTATALALVATAAGVIGQLPRGTAALEAARRTASTTPQKVQSCATYGTSTYCAFPAWNGVRDDWARVVDRVQSAAGGTAATTRLTVRQRIDTEGGVEVDSSLTPSSTPGEVTAGTRWGGNRVPEFAVGVATVLVTGSEAAAQDLCDDVRPVTILWLVLGTDPTPMTTFRNVRLNDTISGSDLVLAPTDSLFMTQHQTQILRELLSRPRAQVSAQVKANWDELTSPDTSTAEAAKLLGVTVPKGAESCAD